MQSIQKVKSEEGNFFKRHKFILSFIFLFAVSTISYFYNNYLGSLSYTGEAITNSALIYYISSCFLGVAMVYYVLAIYNKGEDRKKNMGTLTLKGVLLITGSYISIYFLVIFIKVIIHLWRV